MKNQKNAKAFAYKMWLLVEPNEAIFFGRLVNEGYDPKLVFAESKKIKQHLLKQLSRALLEDDASSGDEKS